MSARPDTKALARKAIPLVGVAFGMLGMAFAAVPLYDWFCRVTGFGGEPMVSDRGADRVLDRTIKVRFDSNVDPDLPWRFKPIEMVKEVRIGETGLAFYEATNTSDEPITGSASYNVSPFSMGGYFVKIDCFCFERQTLEPGQSIMMPVTYFVDPEMVEDAETERVHTVTLSYTFHPAREQARLDTAVD